MAGGAPAASPAGGGRSGRRAAALRSWLLRERREGTEKREKNTAENRLRQDVSRGKKNETAHQSNPIRGKMGISCA